MKTIIFDADGTLFDTAYYFVEVFHAAYKELGVSINRSRIAHVVGMGCDKAVPFLVDEVWARSHGEQLTRIGLKHYVDTYLPQVEIFDGAEKLCYALKNKGYCIALASSSSREIINHYLRLFSEKNIFDYVNTSTDSIKTKPDPDIFLDIVEKCNTTVNQTIVIGDSIWDMRAAKRARIRSIAVLTGGFHHADLIDEGATEIYKDVEDVYQNLHRSILCNES